MNFLEDILRQLGEMGERTVLEEIQEGRITAITGRELLRRIGRARAFLSRRGLKKGDRCPLLAVNGIDWVAMDLAIMAEGLVVVPLYARQAPSELAAMMKDCSPALVCCGDQGLRDGIVEAWPEAPPQCLFQQVFNTEAGTGSEAEVDESDPVAIIYTSGTSGEGKGVVLNAGNIRHMLGCVAQRLDLLMGVPSGTKDRLPPPGKGVAEALPVTSPSDLVAGAAGSKANFSTGQDRVFHYLPFVFAGSWMLLLTSLLRGSLLSINTDLGRLAQDMRLVAPDYFLNVPALLERVRRAVDQQLWEAGGLVQAIYSRAKAAWARKHEGKAKSLDGLWLSLANSAIFPTIRKKMIGRNLRALVCGSAPLSIDTQLFFMMLGIPVLQSYGLTETTAICTLDDPRHYVPGRVGPAIAGIQMKLGENDEILVKGPNIFPGYWNRPVETAKVLHHGWFHTGDQGDVDAEGNWRITGRIKNLIILGSGHNIAPEPIEEKVLARLPGAAQVVLVGDGKGYLSAIVTGNVTSAQVDEALAVVNSELPHYKQIRAFHVRPEAFTVENGLLTANGKLKRELIARTMAAEIEAMYRVKVAV
jgi:long-chain acyl-CoA synthetase